MRRLACSAFAALCLLVSVPIAANAATLRWAASRDIGSLDPVSFGDTFTLAFLNHVYEGLVRYNDQLKIEPALAERWEIVAPTRWRFHLRQGVRFHDGAPLTADDVVASLKRATDDASPLKGNLAAFRDARAVDPATVDVELNSAYPLLLNDLTNIFIFSKPWMVANNALAPTDLGKGVEGYMTRHTNGTGPFKLESRVTDQRTMLVANPDWWDKKRHNLDRIEFLPIGSDATRIAAIVSGQVDYTNAVPLQATQRLEGAAGTKLLLTTELRTIFFAFNLGDKLQNGEPNPLRDERVRRALYLALDVDGIRRSVMRGQSRSTGSLVAPAIPGYAPDLDERPKPDLDGAKRLLAEAGVPQGFGITLLCSTDSYVAEEGICTAAAAMWARIGVKAQLDIGPRAVITSKRVAAQFDLTTLGWANEPAIDALSILVQVLHSNTGSAGLFNWGHWGTPEIDRLTDEASNELDPEKRIGLETEALRIAKARVLFMPLHQQPMAWVVRDDIQSVVQLPDNKARHWLTVMRP